MSKSLEKPSPAANLSRLRRPGVPTSGLRRSGPARSRLHPHLLLHLALGLSLLLMPGCLSGPNFQPPQPSLPPTWSTDSTQVPGASGEGERDLSHWWTVFNDPLLLSLLERAFQANLDLRQAELRIRQARATLSITHAGLGPTADLSAAARRSQSPSSDPATLFQTGFDASWELDLFGGVRRGLEAAAADLQVAEESKRALQVSLAAEIANDYLTVRGLQERLAIARNTLAARKHTAELLQRQFSSGFVGGLASARAQAEVATATAQLPLLESALQQAIQGLAILLAQEPGALFSELIPSAVAIPKGPLTVPLGLPSDLLRRRPDIRRAEAQIHAATARIGVAAADLFPKVTLNGSLGWQDQELGSLLGWGQRVWSMGPTVNWRLFDLGRVRAGVELQKILAEQTALDYQQTILKALLEVENALVAAAQEELHRQSLTAAVVANRRAVELSSQLYAGGQIDFLNVLDSQGALYAAEDALSQSTKAVAANLIALYKALGGGWSESPCQPPRERPLPPS